MDRDVKVSDLMFVNSKKFNTKLNKKIIEIFELESEISNKIGSNPIYLKFPIYMVLSRVYKDLYKIEKYFDKAISFKEYFLEMEDDSKVGTMKIEYTDGNMNEIKEEISIHKGFFSAYVSIIYKLGLFYFNKELIEKSERIESIFDFLREKNKMVAKIPYNYFMMSSMYKLSYDMEFTYTDIKENIAVIIELIEELCWNLRCF